MTRKRDSLGVTLEVITLSHETPCTSNRALLKHHPVSLRPLAEICESGGGRKGVDTSATSDKHTFPSDLEVASPRHHSAPIPGRSVLLSSRPSERSPVTFPSSFSISTLTSGYEYDQVLLTLKNKVTHQP